MAPVAGRLLDQAVDVEPGARQHVGQQRRRPGREPPAGEVVAVERVELLVAGQHPDGDRGAGGEGPVQVGEGEGDPGAGEVQVRAAGPGAAERPAADGQGLEVGLDDP
ncbi:MAG TPA: hypothetical protein VGB14_06355, partial [Acidimicrobiales bacterium]